MIRKMVRQMLTAQIFSALTVSLCLLVDSAIIGRALGETAIAAYGLASPLLLAVAAIGNLLAVGTQVFCSRALARGAQSELDSGYSTALVFSLSVSLLFTCGALLFSGPLATALGAGESGELYEHTRGYINGFALGMPGSMGALVLVPFLQMAGQNTLLIIAVAAMTVADVALDLLNVYVFGGGMFGMGIASAVSYYLALIISCFYFFSKRCAFKFSLRGVMGRTLRALFRGGLPSAFNMLSTVICTLALNRLLTDVGGSSAVAALSVITTIGNNAGSVTTGIYGTSLTLAGLFYAEEDRDALRQLLSQLARSSVILALATGALVLAIAPLAVSIFIPDAGAAQSMAVTGLRIYIAGLLPCCLNNALKSIYQATDRVPLMAAISVAEGAALPILVAFTMSRFAGTTGAWFYFPLGELCALAAIMLYVYLKTRRAPFSRGNCLLLRSDFGADDADRFETTITTLDEAMATARAAGDFCLQRGVDAGFSNHVAVCVEEMAVNVIKHGFSKDTKPHTLSLRLLRKGEGWVLRFRDDCTAFDPLHYVPATEDGALGIKLMLAMASEAAYTYSLNLNCLTLRLYPGKPPHTAQG